MTWTDMTPKEKVAWLRETAKGYENAALILSGYPASARSVDTAAALTELADRIEWDERRRERARYLATKGDAP